MVKTFKEYYEEFENDFKLTRKECLAHDMSEKQMSSQPTVGLELIAMGTVAAENLPRAKARDEK